MEDDVKDKFPWGEERLYDLPLVHDKQVREIAKAQLKKVVDWLKSGTMIAIDNDEVGITLTKASWLALLKEIE